MAKSKAKSYVETDFVQGIEGILAARLSLSAWFIPLALAVLMIALMIWAWLAEVDVVSAATGEIVPSQEVQLIQAKDVGIVKAILVNNGDRVVKGQLLVELADRDLQGQLLENQEQLRQLAIEVLVLSRQMQCFDSIERCLHMPIVATQLQAILDGQEQMLFEHLTTKTIQVAQSLLQERWHSYLRQQELRANKIDVLHTQLQQKQAEIAYSKTLLPMYEKRLQRMQTLQDEQLTAGAMVEDEKEKMMRQQQNLQTLQLEQQNLLAQIKVARSELDAYVHESRANVSDAWLTELSDFRTRISARQRMRTMLAEKHIRSPIEGTVFERNIATVGGVVQSAAVLMKVLPIGTVLQGKINVLNKDRGFIDVGDEVTLKIDAYPFTKHGSIQGRVTRISSAAVLDEQLGAVYPTIVSFSSVNVTVNKQPAPIIPGMTLVGDIYQGKRLLAEYVLAPLLRHKAESLRER